MKLGQKLALILTLATGTALILVSIFNFAQFQTPNLTSRLLSSGGILIDIAGFLQLNISGLFEKILSECLDDEKYPYGPPSPVARHIIDNPDRYYYNLIRYTFFHNAKTGYWLIITGATIQIIAIWQ